MLEMTKKILRSVSFDPVLFRKELYKAMSWISEPAELRAFRIWCIREFGHKYPGIIQQAFFA
jgi:hypothetical protein